MKKVVLYSKMFKNGFSGGRYCALFLAQAFSSLGYGVDIVCQEKPGIESEFLDFPSHKNINFIINNEFDLDYGKDDYQYIILIPDQSKHHYYDKCFAHAGSTNTPLIFMNFESANWYNEVSPYKKPEELWDMWKEASKRKGVILSISEEGMNWSKPFYKDVHKESLFDFWYPAINSFAAKEYIGAKKKNQITTITRFADKHKGADDFCSLVCEELSGVTINLISSREITESDLPTGTVEDAKKYNIEFTYLKGLSDEEKFKIISESRIFVFPTYFEGLGYPPLECLYVNTPVVTYDLPVLRETMENCIDRGVYMVPVGDRVELRKQVVRLYEENKSIDTHELIKQNTQFDKRVLSLQAMLKKWNKHFGL